MKLVKKQDVENRRIHARCQRAAGPHHRPAHLPAPHRHRGRRCRRGHHRFDAHDATRGCGVCRSRRRQGRDEAIRLHALLGRLRNRRRGAGRRLDRPGARFRFAHQPRRSLRQGRRGSRTRPRRQARQVPDEARGRQVATFVVGPGHRRDRRQGACDSRAAQPGFRLLAGLGEVLERAVVPVQEIRRDVGFEQRRPPGAHLPFDDGGRRGEYLGLRRDDQLVQRHAPVQVDVLHRQQCRRGAPGRHAAHPARQGERRAS